MILTRLDEIKANRVHTPKWAVSTNSGVGAAKHGEHVNRPGVDALYLALVLECVPPVSCASIVGDV